MHDEAGRLIRSITTREPEWSDEERGWMLALAYRRAGLCPRCRDELETTASPLHDTDDPTAPRMYKRTKLTRCHRCTATIRSEREHAKALQDFADTMPPEAVLHHIELVPRGG